MSGILFQLLNTSPEVQAQTHISGTQMHIQSIDVHTPGLQTHNEWEIHWISGNIHVYDGDIQNNNPTNEVFPALSQVRVHMDWTSTQSIGGTTPINFYDLIINNWSDIVLQEDQKVRNELEFVQGLLELNGQQVDLWISGRLINETNASRATDITSGWTIRAERALNSPTNEDDPNLRLEISYTWSLWDTEIIRWHTQQAAGTWLSIYLWYTVNPLTAPSGNITKSIEYFDGEMPSLLDTGPENEFDIRQDDGSQRNRQFWTPNAWANTVTATSTNFDNMITIWWTITNPLPVTWLSFQADCDTDQNTILVRQTASETNSDYFQVQRSYDGQEREGIGEVQAAWHSSQVVSYEFVDNNPKWVDKAYYRLRQVDFNGESDYSSVIASNCNPSNIESLMIYPNPSNGTNITIQLQTHEQAELPLSVTDMTGRQIEYKRITVTSGMTHHYLDMSQYAPGAYILSVDGKQTRVVITN